MICSNGAGRENISEVDWYSLIRSAEIRDYYRREDVCDDLEKKIILIQHGFISVQQKAAMLRKLSGTGTVKENRLAEEMSLLYSQYIDMIYHPAVRTLFLLQSGILWWNVDTIDDNLSLHGVYESLDEVIAQMEEVYVIYDKAAEKACAYVTVLHVPPDEKVKEVFKFIIFWIDGKWEIIDFIVDDKELESQEISSDAIDLFARSAGWQYHPLPFENGCRLRFRLPFMDGPFYGTLESEQDGNGCWYHFLNFDEERKRYVDLTYAEVDQINGLSSLDWIERA